MSTQPPSRTKFYLDKKHGKVMGVCAGLADYTGFDVTLVRILFVLGVFMGGGALIPVYLIAGIIARDKPRELEETDPEEKRFWQGVRTSPSRTARDIKSRFRDIDRRLAQIEHYVTVENRSLAREIEQATNQAANGTARAVPSVQPSCEVWRALRGGAAPAQQVPGVAQPAVDAQVVSDICNNIIRRRPEKIHADDK